VPDPNEKSWWDRVQIVGKALSPILLALLGYAISRDLNGVQARNSDNQLYSQLMATREQADTALRQSMFESVLKMFLESRPGGSERDILNLELLADNFHETLNLKSLFLHLQRQIKGGTNAESNEALESRLIDLAKRVSEQELRVLKESGAVASIDFNLDRSAFDPIDGSVSVDGHEELHEPGLSVTAKFARHYSVQLLKVFKEEKELRLRLMVDAPEGSGPREMSTVIRAGYFDFPMVENIRLSHGQRCAVVVEELSDAIARISVAFFPGSRASLKERPYYDEILDELLHTREGMKEHRQ